MEMHIQRHMRLYACMHVAMRFQSLGLTLRERRSASGAPLLPLRDCLWSWLGSWWPTRLHATDEGGAHDNAGPVSTDPNQKFWFLG